MGGVHDHRIAGARHDRQRPHVGHKGVVAKTHAAFGQQDVFVAGRGDLVGHIRHAFRGEKLALFDVDDGTGFARSDQKVGLAAQKGRDLDDIDHRRRCIGLFDVVDVGQHRHAHGAHGLEHLEPALHAKAAPAFERGAVGLVIAGLEDILRPSGTAYLCHVPGDHLGMGQAFKLTGAGDHQQRPVIGHREIADLHVFHHGAVLTG